MKFFLFNSFIFTPTYIILPKPLRQRNILDTSEKFFGKQEVVFMPMETIKNFIQIIIEMHETYQKIVKDYQELDTK